MFKVYLVLRNFFPTITEKQLKNKKPKLNIIIEKDFEELKIEQIP